LPTADRYIGRIFRVKNPNLILEIIYLSINRPGENELRELKIRGSFREIKSAILFIPYPEIERLI